MEKKFDKGLSVVEENNFGTEITNAYIAYDLDVSAKILLNNS